MIVLDYKDRRPIYEQVVERFQELVIRGALPADTQLPSVRTLAMELSINPNTIQRAYAELERRDIIYSVKGKGSFIAAKDTLLECKRRELLLEAEQFGKKAWELGIDEGELLYHVKRYWNKEDQTGSKDTSCIGGKEDTAAGKG